MKESVNLKSLLKGKVTFYPGSASGRYHNHMSVALMELGQLPHANTISHQMKPMMPR